MGTDQQTIRRFTGICGIGSFLCTAIAVAVATQSGVNVSTISAHLLDVIFPVFAPQTGSLVSYTLGIFMAGLILLAGFVTGLANLNSWQHWSFSITSRLLVMGVILFLVETLVTVGLTKGLSPVVTNSEEISVTLQATGQTFIAFRNYTAITAGLLTALAGIGLGVVYMHNSKVLGNWAIVAGSLGLAGALWPVVPFMSYFRNAGYMLFLIWVFVVGVSLLKIPESES